jgi:hypothetical protein
VSDAILLFVQAQLLGRCKYEIPDVRGVAQIFAVDVEE